VTPAQAPNVDGVRTASSGRLDASASCGACGLIGHADDGAAWLAIRAKARRHVAATGHTVRAELTTFYVYAPDPRAGS
jgi:uncharacterized protein (DUF2126 family)